jgi:hypothetical protein
MSVTAGLLALALLPATALQSPPAASPPAGDARLDFLVGEWATRNTHHAGPAGPAGTSNGTTRCRWDMAGVWLLYESSFEAPGLGPYEVRGGVARDARTGGYRAFAYNTLGALVEYEGAWQAEGRLVFTALRTAPGRGAHVVYEKRPDGSVRFVAESERDDGGFAPYFESSMTR